MSNRKNLEIYNQLNIDRYVSILKEEYGAREHPDQPSRFLVGEPGTPFYHPEQAEDPLYITDVNWTPFPRSLIHALVEHPELAPDDTFII